MPTVRSILRRVRRAMPWSKARRMGPPVVIYQMGKVASSTLNRSLSAIDGLDVYQVHLIDSKNMEYMRGEYERRNAEPPEEELGRFLHRRYIAKEKPLRVISLVREPIGRNISAFFQILDRLQGKSEAHADRTIEELAELFFGTYLHDVPLKWFDREFKPTMKIDVYEHAFPKHEGVVALDSGPWKLLVMRHDLADERKVREISRLIGVDSFELNKVNVGAAKPYAATYRQFVDQVRVPEEYADRMLGSKYAKHFFPDDELERLFRRWTRGKSELE